MMAKNVKAEEYLHGTSVNGESGRDYFDRKSELWPTFWQGLGFAEEPDMRGKRFLDVGCGHGAFVVQAAIRGAEATGIDLAPQKMRVGQEEANQVLKSGGGSVRFLDADGAELRATPFDMMISYETFEHVDNLPALLANLHALLVPGGVFYVCWGGIWPSVFGGHYWLQKSILGIPIPWSHRVCTRPDARPGVNQLDYADYARIIKASPFSVVSWEENVGQHWAYKVFRLLARIPGFRDAFTQNFYVVLRRAK